MNTTLKRILMATTACAVMLMPIAGAMAQAETGAVLEEIIVTATKRSVGMQDVPISLAVMTGDDVEAMAIYDLQDISAYMPTVHIGVSGSANQIFIRGVGSGNNMGFEQSVGTFIDGVYYGRSRNSRAAFMDVERVEVLKGPQSTLFGKNTVGGAINITSRKPTEEFEGYVEVNHETELDAVSITGALSGPLTDRLRGRLVGKKYQDDGYMINSASNGEDGPAKLDAIYRGSLVWDATDKLQLSAKFEHGQYELTGKAHKITISTPTSTFLFGLGGDPDFADSVGFNYKQSVSGFPGRNEYDKTESNIYQLTGDYLWGEHNLRSITAYTEYEFGNCTDADYSSLAFIDRCRDEKHEQFTQEFLLMSPIGGEFEYLAGLYYQKADLQSDTSTMLGLSSLPPIEGYILGLVGGLPGSLDTEFLNAFSQTSKTYSAFAEGTFHFTDTFRGTIGFRYSNDTKDADKQQITAAPGGVVSDPFLGFVMGPAVLGFNAEYDYSETREEDHLTGSVNLQYDVNDDVMTYLTVSNGYKAGGFDADNSLDRSREFEDENVVSYELGAKMDLLDGRARVNASVFKTKLEDLQVSGFEATGFIVGNAGKSDIFGAEADFLFAMTDRLTLNGAYSYLDAEYEEYPNAACTVDQQLDGSCALNGGFQDLSGTPLQFAPDSSGNFGATYIVPLNEGVDLSFRVDSLFTGDILIAPDGDANVTQGSYWKLNARISAESTDGRWEIALIGKNLTDELTFNWGNDATLSGLGFGFENAYFHMLEKPRTVALQVRVHF